MPKTTSTKNTKNVTKTDTSVALAERAEGQQSQPVAAKTEEHQESSELSQRMVMPAVSTDEAFEAWRTYQDLKGKIIDPATDVQVIRGQEFKKKSYWRKVAAFFNLSIETREEWKEMLGKTLVWHFTVRATAPNGRYVEGVGSCDVYEKAVQRDGKYMTYNTYKNKWEEAISNSPHNTRSTAYTRAFNRAVADMVGGGEVSAEEIQALQESHYTEQRPASAAKLEQRQSWQVSRFPDPTESHHDQAAADEMARPANQGWFKCEKCDTTVPLNTKLKSQERYDGHTFCFKHQIEYKRMQLAAKQGAAA